MDVNIIIEGQLDFDPDEEVARFVLTELGQVYLDTNLQAQYASSVIRYIRDEGLYPPDDGNALAITYLIKHLYGILEQVGR